MKSFYYSALRLTSLIPNWRDKSNSRERDYNVNIFSQMSKQKQKKSYVALWEVVY